MCQKKKAWGVWTQIAACLGAQDKPNMFGEAEMGIALEIYADSIL